MLNIDEIDQERLVSILMTNSEYLTDRSDLTVHDMAAYLLDDFMEDCDKVLSFLDRIGNKDTDIYKVVQKLSEGTEQIYSYDVLYRKMVNAVILSKTDRLL